jgi:hypothetical protein
MECAHIVTYITYMDRESGKSKSKNGRTELVETKAAFIYRLRHRVPIYVLLLQCETCCRLYADLIGDANATSKSRASYYSLL